MTTMAKLASAGLAFWFIACVSARSGTVASHKTEPAGANDGTRPYEIVVLAEGYSKGDVADGLGNQGDFHADVDYIVEAGAMDYEPFASNRARFKVRRVPMVSKDRGVAGENEPGNTAFGVKFHGDKDRCYFTVSGASVSAISAAARERGNADFIVVLVNAGASKGVGCAINDKIALVTRTVGGLGLAHELGHTISDLYDEYPGGKVVSNSTTITSGNCTTARVQTDAPWSHLITQSISVPTPPKATIPVAMYEGCAHYDKDVYRPTRRCMMNQPPFKFCVVCRGLLMSVINKLPKAGSSLYERIRVLVPAGDESDAIVVDRWPSVTPPPSGPQPLHNVWVLTLGDRVLAAVGTSGEASFWRAHDEGGAVPEMFVPAPYQVVELAIPRFGLPPPIEPDKAVLLRLFAFSERTEAIAPAGLTTIPTDFPGAKVTAKSPQLTSDVMSLFQ